MSNQDQAAQVIRTWQKRHKNAMDDNPDWAAQNLAGDLQRAGLLAPDLPEPDRTPDGHFGGYLVWEDEKVWTVDDEVAVYTDIPESFGWMTPKEARTLAHALLAAADYSEEEL